MEIEIVIFAPVFTASRSDFNGFNRKREAIDHCAKCTENRFTVGCKDIAVIGFDKQDIIVIIFDYHIRYRVKDTPNVILESFAFAIEHLKLCGRGNLTVSFNDIHHLENLSFLISQDALQRSYNPQTLLRKAPHLL